MRFGLARACACMAMAGFFGVSQLAAQSYDLLIRGGRVLDGTGNPEVVADVAIRDGVIVAVGNLGSASAERTIDANGMHVTPGFIDMHSHADRTLYGGDAKDRAAANLVAQGITTIVVGPDGRNPDWPISAEIAGYESLGVGLNIVPMVGHGSVRGEVMGDDYERHATPEEVALMKAQICSFVLEN